MDEQEELDGVEMVHWSKVFGKREQGLISNCVTYAMSNPAGLPGHNLMIIIAKMYQLLGSTTGEGLVDLGKVYLFDEGKEV